MSDLSGLYKFKVQRYAPESYEDAEGNVHQTTRHYPVGTIHSLEHDEAKRSLEGGFAVPFGEHGCPNCEKQERPCSFECFAGHSGPGATEVDYVKCVIDIEDRKRDAASEWRTHADPAHAEALRFVAEKRAENAAKAALEEVASTTDDGASAEGTRKSKRPPSST